MKKIKIEELLKKEEYGSVKKFIESDKRVSKVLFLCFGGSYSYGTNNESSDIDIRGVFIPTKDVLLGFNSFDVYEDKNTDTVLYSLPKFIKLTSESNPNILEMLFCNEDDYLFMCEEGRLLFSKRNLFLTKRAYFTFGHYAFSQLSKIEEATVERGKNILCETREEREKDVLLSLILKYDLDENSISLTENKTFNFALNNCSYNTCKNLFMDFINVLTKVDEPKKLGSKNTKKPVKIDKHMMHLVRLYLMALEILEKNTLHTYRGNYEEHNLLMNIRNGKYRNESGSIVDSFYELVKDLKVKTDLAFEKSTLPFKTNQEEVFKLYVKLINI